MYVSPRKIVSPYGCFWTLVTRQWHCCAYFSFVFLSSLGSGLEVGVRRLDSESSAMNKLCQCVKVTARKSWWWRLLLGFLFILVLFCFALPQHTVLLEQEITGTVCQKKSCAAGATSPCLRSAEASSLHGVHCSPLPAQALYKMILGES